MSLAILVALSASLSAAPADLSPRAGGKTFTLENSCVRLEISEYGRLDALVSKASKKNYAAVTPPVGLMTVRRKGLPKPVPLRRVQLQGDVLTARFADPDVTAQIKVTSRDRYFLFEVLGVEKVTIEDRELLLGSLTDQIKKLERARKGLSHEWATIDSRGRITLRKRLMVQLGWRAGDILDLLLYPDAHKPRGLLLLREAF